MTQGEALTTSHIVDTAWAPDATSAAHGRISLPQRVEQHKLFSESRQVRIEPG